MREYAKKPENQFRTLDSNSKASKQAPIDVILQRYKEQNIHRSAEREDKELVQGKFDIVQRNEIDEYELLQGKFESTSKTQQEAVQREEKLNNTGLPDNLKTGIEKLSGYSMDDVRVHYNSGKPAQLQALAYTQGTDIHMAPGQEKHLPHEAWHVVQQKQGRVQPTMQLQGMNVNYNEGLEREADLMEVNSANDDQSTVLKKTYMDMANKSETYQFALGPIKWTLFTGSALFSHPKRAAWAANNGNDWQHATQLYNILIQFNLGTDNLGWTPANLVTLAGLFGADAGVCTSHQWGQIAEAHINLINQENDVATFARVAGWAPANLVTLAGLFGADAGGKTLTNWILIANELLNDAITVSAIARLTIWNDATIPQLINILKPLVIDGMIGIQILTLFNRWITAGQNATQINDNISDLRGNLAHANPPTNAERPITMVAGGEQKLSGLDIYNHVETSVTAGRSTLNTSTHYPTGQPIAGKTVDQLWQDCGMANLYNDANTGTAETAIQISIRQKQALNQLMINNPAQADIIQNIFLHNFGQTPRPFVSVVNEDGYIIGAHTQAKHVLGTGTGLVDTHNQLAERAGWKTPPPNPGATASAYTNLANANVNVGAALIANFAPNWVARRQELTTGVMIPAINFATGPTGIRYRKTDAPVGVAYPNLAVHYAPRPLIGPGPGGAPPLGLTHDATHTINQIRVIIRATNNNPAHGWGIYTSYPTS